MSWPGKMRPKDADTVALVGCPDCEASKGAPCVYMPVLYPSQDRGQVGQVMTRAVHQGRSHRAWMARRRRQQAEDRAAQAARPVSELVAIARAEQAFEQAERRALVTWLTRHAHILITAGCGPRPGSGEGS